MGMASVNRSSPRFSGGFSADSRPVLTLFTSAEGPGSGESTPDPPARPFTPRPPATNRVWAIERVGPPTEPKAPDQLAKVAMLWADATMLLLAALGTALLVIALVL